MDMRMRLVTVAALVAPFAACSHAPAPAVPVIDWRTSPLDLNLRGMNGTRYLFRCMAGKPVPQSVAGSGVYTDGSAICAAAAHAGAVDPRLGGVVMIQVLPGQQGYRGSLRHFIRSEDYRPAWGGSFAVLPAARPHAAPPQ